MAIEIGTAIATLQTIAGVVRKAGQIELTAQVLELQQTMLALLADQATQLDEAQRLRAELQELRDENAELRAKLGTRAALSFEHNAYWLGDGRDVADGPICAPCFDTKGQLVRMLRDANAEAFCRGCNTRIVYDPSKRTPRRSISSRPDIYSSDF